MKFTSDFFGASHMNGEIYPREYKAGDNCPVDLLESALAVGAVKAEAKAEKKAKA